MRGLLRLWFLQVLEFRFGTPVPPERRRRIFVQESYAIPPTAFPVKSRLSARIEAVRGLGIKRRGFQSAVMFLPFSTRCNSFAVFNLLLRFCCLQPAVRVLLFSTSCSAFAAFNLLSRCCCLQPAVTLLLSSTCCHAVAVFNLL